MGSRGNIIMDYGDGKEIYLYTHWGGTYLPQILQRVLQRHLRWNDESYLARMIFSEMVKDDIFGETGYGIAPYPPDNENDYLVVNCLTQTITIKGYSKDDGKIYGFQEFCDIKFNEN